MGIDRLLLKCGSRQPSTLDVTRQHLNATRTLVQRQSIHSLPPGKLTKNDWTLPLMVDSPIKNGDFPYSYVSLPESLDFIQNDCLAPATARSLSCMSASEIRSRNYSATRQTWWLYFLDSWIESNKPTCWLIPCRKWVVILDTSGLTPLMPLITRGFNQVPTNHSSKFERGLRFLTKKSPYLAKLVCKYMN